MVSKSFVYMQTHSCSYIHKKLDTKQAWRLIYYMIGRKHVHCINVMYNNWHAVWGAIITVIITIQRLHQLVWYAHMHVYYIKECSHTCVVTMPSSVLL